ncbi:MAG: metallophosphoesterase [Oscillospiraceae bacterium]|nr:metallophosphoesterase [Oscillospiraceae bacterium]
MKILVLSDSHSALRFMHFCVSKIRPDAIIHLGDHYDDGEALREEFPDIPLYQVPGNCDCYRCPPDACEVLVIRLDGVRLFMTHGHRHRVKQATYALLEDARQSRADIVCYGHTHVPNCYQESDGLWVLNPGSCGYFGGTAGLVETRAGKIKRVRILREPDL